MYKLMIVDDEPLTRQYVRTYLSALHADWECAGEAEDGQEALELLDSGQAFDLIITDIKMPVMNGLELARRISERKLKTRMVIISGYDEFSLAKEAMRYGVHDYLLKPLVNEELVVVLSSVRDQLEADRNDLLAYNAMVALSVETKSQASANFLRAVVSGNDMEIKALYPLLSRLKVCLLEGEGTIMLTELDEVRLLQRGTSASDMALFRYIVHQTASELAAEVPGTTVFIDGEQRTAMLVTGDDAVQVRSRCRQLFDQLSEAILRMTGIPLWGAVGSLEIDALLLHPSYREANRALKGRLFANEPGLFEYPAADLLYEARVKKIDNTIAALPAALMDAHDLNRTAALKAFVEAIGMAAMDERKALLFGVYLVKRLSGLIEGTGQQTLALAMSALRQYPASHSSSVEDWIERYNHLLQLFRQQDSSSSPASNEHDIVIQAKNYIYAHYAEPLSLALIAEQTGVTPGYLSSLFHQNVNESYIKFLTRVRMERAAQLLQAKPAEKVYDVSEKVGYVSVKHFSHVFKQHYGMPPGEYQDKALG